jgi:hypothetical protein
MEKDTRYLGLDVHAETIVAALAEGRGRVRNLGKYCNTPESVRKLIDQLGGPVGLKACYEARPDWICAVLAACETWRRM